MRNAAARLSAAVTTRSSLAVMSAAAFVLAVAATVPNMFHGGAPG
jgi:hypothetical protein